MNVAPAGVHQCGRRRLPAEDSFTAGQRQHPSYLAQASEDHPLDRYLTPGEINPIRLATRQCLTSLRTLPNIPGISNHSVCGTVGSIKRQIADIVAYGICAAVLVCLPAAAVAQQPPFQRDPVDQYMSRFLAVVILIGAGLVLWSLGRYRGRDVGATSWGFLIAGTCVFPIMLSGVGSILALQRVRTVPLCGSCHLTMKSYVDDMMNPKSNSLAAVHFSNRYIAENQCYECHTSYGMLGTLQSKKQGVIDVYKYYTHTFQLPLQLRQPYRDGDCLKCHAGATKFIAAHEESQERIFAGKVSCMQCHAESHPAHNHDMVAQGSDP